MKLEKLTKSIRRVLAADERNRQLLRAIQNGYRMHSEGDIITMSDRRYRVAADGSFRRIAR